MADITREDVLAQVDNLIDQMEIKDDRPELEKWADLVAEIAEVPPDRRDPGFLTMLYEIRRSVRAL